MNRIWLWIPLVLMGMAGLLASEGKLLWKQNLFVEAAGGPAIFQDRAAVVTRNGALFVFDQSGQLIWKRDLKVPLVSAPSYDETGFLWLADLAGLIRSFSPDGDERLVFSGTTAFRTTPLHGIGLVVVCDEAGVLRYIDRASGRVLHVFELNVPVFSSGLVLGDGSVLQPGKDYVVMKLSADGRHETWFSGSGVILSSPAAMGDGRIAISSMDHHLYLLKTDGRAQFRFKAKGWIIASPVIDEAGRMYFGSYDRHFYAVDNDGKLAWSVPGHGGFNATPVIDDGGVIYSGDGSGRIYAVSRQGRILWQYRSQDYVRSALALFPDHAVLLAASLDGWLYALKAEAALSKKARWPSYLGDERNSGRVK